MARERDDRVKEAKTIVGIKGVEINSLFGTTPEWLGKAKVGTVPLGSLYQYFYREEGKRFYQAVFLPTTWKELSLDPSAATDPYTKVIHPYWYQASAGGEDAWGCTLELSLPFGSDEREVFIYKPEERPHIVCLQNVVRVPGRLPPDQMIIPSREFCKEEAGRRGLPFRFTRVSLDEIVGENGAFDKLAHETPLTAGEMTQKYITWWQLLERPPSWHDLPR